MIHIANPLRKIHSQIYPKEVVYILQLYC